MNFASGLLSGLPIGSFGHLLLRCGLLSFVLLVATWSVVWRLRGRSAALKHRVLLLALTGILFLPAMIPLVQPWNPVIRLNLQWERESVPPTTDGATFENGLIAPIGYGAGDESRSAVSVPSAEPFELSSPPLDVASLGENDRGEAAIEVAASMPYPSRTAKSSKTANIVLEALIPAAWAIGASLLGFRLLTQRLLVEKIVRTAIPIADRRTLEILNSINRSNLAVTLRCSDSTQAPIVVGIFRQAIILPAGYGKWSNDRLHVVLMHELNHIRRRDVLAQSMAQVACVLYWLNPLVWQAARRMRLERELACDDAMLCAGENADDYADHLVEIASAIMNGWRAPQAASAMAAQTNLQTRVRHLLRSDLDRRVVSNRASALLAAAAIGLVALFAIAAPSIATTPADDGRSEADQRPGDASTSTEGHASATEFTLSGDAPADWFERLKALPNVRKLTVRSPNLRHFKARQLRDLPQLASFHAEDFPLDLRLVDAVAASLADLPNLETVAFERTGLTRRGLQLLQHSPITELTLKEEEFLTDDAYEHVAKMNSLRKLVLEATPIEVAGLEHLRRCPQLRSFALRRHPAGSIKDGADGRLVAIAGLGRLEDLELESTAYERLPVLQQIASLKRLTLRRCGAFEASGSLKQLKQLDKVSLDNCDIRNESFGDVKTALAEVGIEVVDITPEAQTDLLTRDPSTVNDATKIARQLHEELDIAKHHPAFWVRWRLHSNETPSMKSEPIRTIYRLKKTLSEEQVRRPLTEEGVMAWAPQQFYFLYEVSEDGVVSWEQVEYGDAKAAWARERRAGNPATHVIRNGASKFVDSFIRFPHQLRVSQQTYWWGVGIQHTIATSPVSPQQATYTELPAEEFAGEPCRVLESAGRSERLWISKETGRLRGSLSYIHQGYFIPFHSQNIVTQIAGRPVTSLEGYRALFGEGSDALPSAKQRLLSQAWAEYSFDHAIPCDFNVFSDYREIAPGRWFPFRVQSAGWSHNQQNQGRYDFHSFESVVTEVAVDRDDLQKYWADALPKKGETVQDQRSERPIHYKYGDDRKGDEPQGQIEVPVRDKNNVAAEEQESPPAVEAPQRPSLDELIQKIAEYERAYFPFHMKSIETFRMNEGLAAEERDRYPWGDGRKHARLLEYAQKADWIWVRKETQVLDDKPAGSRSEWYSDGDREVQFPNASPNSPLQADVFIERDRTRIGKWTYATPTAGIFPLTAFSNGDLFTSVFPRGRQVQLAWDDGDARLTFEFGPGRIHTRYELWLSRNHDWHPVRLRRYMRSDAMAFFDEWSVTKFAKREGRWRVAEGTVRYHDHQDAASPDAKLMYSVDFKVLEAEWGKLLPDELFKYKIPQGANIRERVASGRRADD